MDPQQASSLLVTKYLQIYKGKFQLIPQTELIFASEKKWPMRLTGLHGQKRVQSRLRAEAGTDPLGHTLESKVLCLLVHVLIYHSLVSFLHDYHGLLWREGLRFVCVKGLAFLN